MWTFLMAGLARGLSAVVGSSAITLPLALVALLTVCHEFIKARDAKLETTATASCNNSWMLTVANKKQRDAERNAQSARELMAGERRINEGLGNELEAIRRHYAELANASAVELAAAKAKAAEPTQPVVNSDAERCLSDSLLDDIRRRQELGNGGGGRRKGGG